MRKGDLCQPLQPPRHRSYSQPAYMAPNHARQNACGMPNWMHSQVLRDHVRDHQNARPKAIKKTLPDRQLRFWKYPRRAKPEKYSQTPAAQGHQYARYFYGANWSVMTNG